MLDDERGLTAIEKLQCLKTFGPFAGLAPAKLGPMAQAGHERLFAKGERLFRKASSARDAYFVVEGRVLEARGQRMRETGDAIGLLELLAGDDRSADAIADTETVVIGYRHETLRDVLEDEFAVYCALLNALARALIEHVDASALWASSSSSSAPPRATSPGRNPGAEVDLAQRILFLAKAFSFARGSIASLALVARSIEEVRLPKGTLLWSEGDRADQLALVAAGALECTTSRGVSRRLGPYGSPGMLGVLAAASQPCTVAAAEDSLILVVDGTTLIDTLEDDPETAMELLGVLSRLALNVDAATPRSSSPSLSH